MTVVCRPGVSTLARIVAVLHARNAEVLAMHYAQDSGIVLDVVDPDPRFLCARLQRLVDVTDVRLAVPAPAAVAS